MKSYTMKLTALTRSTTNPLGVQIEKFVKRFFAFSILTFVLAGCASNGPTGETVDWKARSEARSAKYWGLIVTSKFDEAYELLTPSSRQTISKEAYAVQMRGLRAASAKVDKSKCSDENFCTIDLKMEVQIRIPRIGFRTTPLDHQEVWTLSNGEMYLIRK